MKRIKIKDWIHAIDLTIERHQAVLGGKYEDYLSAREYMRPENWEHACPLCEYASRISKKNVFMYEICEKCLWIKFENERCHESDKYDYTNDNKSIRRLNRWKKRLLKTNNKERED